MGFLLPFFLAGAGGDSSAARAAIREMVEEYAAATATELDLVGRIIGFSVMATDNLRLSMKPDLSDTKVLRYRSNAVALSRASEQCRKMLEALQANRKPGQKPMTISAADTTPATTIAPIPVPPAQPAQAQPAQAQPAQAQPAQAQPAQAQPEPAQAQPAQARPTRTQPMPSTPSPSTSPSPIAGTSLSPQTLEAMKRDARTLLASFSATGSSALASGVLSQIEDPDKLVSAAVRQAIVASQRGSTA